MANPFYVEPPNVLQALMMGQQGFNTAQKAGQDAAIRQGRIDAVQAMQQGGDLRTPLMTLLGVGDVQGANSIANYAQQQATQAHMQATEKQAAAQLAETTRHNKAAEGLSQSTAAATAMAPVKIGSDLAGDVYARRNPKSGQYEIIDVNALRNGGAAAPQQGNNGAALSGDEFLKTLPTGLQPIIKKIAGYEMDPKSSSITGGHRERILSAVAQYDPTYDAATFPARQRAVQAFATGPQGNTVRSFDVAISHMQTGRDLVKAMANGDYPLLNKLKNEWQNQTGNPAPGNFDAAKEIIGDEIVKAVVGSNTQALGDRQAIKENIKNAKSPQQLLGVLDTYEELMAGQVKGLKKQYEDTTGRKDFDGRLNQVTRDRLSRADHRSANSNISEGTTATNPKTGEKIMLRGGQWVPAQ